MRILVSLCVIFLVAYIPFAVQSKPIAEPIAERRPVTSYYHNIPVTDEYAWLKANNWQEALNNPSILPKDIRDYLNAENEYFYAKMVPTRNLQETLYHEMVGRVEKEGTSVPAVDNDYAYFWRNLLGKDYRLLVRRPTKFFQKRSDVFSLTSNSLDEVILDVNKWAEGKSSFNLGATKHSYDHRFLAYSVDYQGSEHFQIFIRDLKTGKELPDILNDTDGNIVWLVDGSGFFYVRKGKDSRPRSVWRHRLGTSQDKDVLVLEASTNSGLATSVWTTRNHKFYGITVGDYQSNEIYLIDSKNVESKPMLLAKREAGLRYGIAQYEDRFFIRTNAGGADDFKIVTVPLKTQIETPGRKYWKDFISHKPGRMIVSIDVFANHLVRMERENGLERLVIHRLSDGKEHTVEFKEEAYDLSYSAGYEFNTDTIRIYYSSLTTPKRVYDYNMQTRKMVLRKEQQIPSGHKISDYVTRRLWVAAHDGEKIPVSLLYHKNTVLDGTAPVFMYAYGAYGKSIYSSFRRNSLSLVNRGFILVLAHVRGGMERGYGWYKNGRGDKKINTYKDYISVANHLIKEKYTSPGRIIAYGVSAGGMVTGYVANETNDLFCAIIAEAPFVDVLNTMLDKSLPLTPSEWPEWGNPIESVEDFKNIQSYSPYDNVRAKAYPHILVLGSASDSRVTYWEPAKWVAKLRALRTNDNVLMLRTNMSAGHTGTTGRYSSLRGVAMIYAFAIKAAGGSRCSVMKTRKP